jgi:P-type Ca2+ transporter type 2C
MEAETTSSPPRIITNSPSNLLNVPGTAPSTSHQRSQSFGSNGTFGWTPSPSTAMTPSDIGDPKGEQRNLLKSETVEAEIPENPFAFTPKVLAKLHDPKDLNVLRQMGGLDGLVYGLRSDVKIGLSPDEDKLDGRVTLQNVWDVLETRKKEHVKQEIDDKLEKDNVQGNEIDVVLEESSAGKLKRNESRKSTVSRRPTLVSVKSQPTVSKGFSDRKRIFSENRIPARKPKNIFQLMWMALHDKILVRPSNCFTYNRYS